jgi:glycosyltransferase involved in cell wall biosynthesis
VDRTRFLAVFSGTFSRRFDLETVLKAARVLESEGEAFQFVLCGGGESFDTLQRQAEGSASVLLPGWLPHHEIAQLMRTANATLAPYFSTSSFIVSYPNKTFEYLAAGLPVVSSLHGLVEELLNRERCGLTYAEGDVDALVRHLRWLRDHPDRASDMGRRARALFDREFSSETVYATFATHLEAIHADHERRP